MYYVYEWFIVETGEVIYVGKGTGRRYKVRKHNRLFNEMIRRFECDSRIVKEFGTEREAFEFEFVRINEMHECGQCVCNIHNGGYGGTVEWWTDELLAHYSEINVMKSEEQRKRMSDNNPMKDKKIAEKTNSRKRKAVIIGEREYPSIKAVCEAYHTSSEVVATWCKKGVNAKGEKCKYKGLDQVDFTDKRYNKGGSRAVVYKDVRYECIKDFAIAIGIGERTASEWLKRGFNPDGIPCRYENDARELVFINKHVARNKAKSKPVIVNGVEYKSCEEASKALGIAKTTIYSYLQGIRKSTKYICKYGNQQPSRGNTDDSTPEGSTTNR